MRIDIWTDIVCPFCYIGKRHLEEALLAFEHADEVEIVWRSFELDSGAPAQIDGTLADVIAKKYGLSPAQAQASQAALAARAAEVGLDFNWRGAKPGNTFDAHRLVHLAQAKGLGNAVIERFKLAYFTQGEAIGDASVLRRLAVEAGLDEAEVAEVLTSTAFAEEVRQDEALAREIGIGGVPFFVFDERLAVSGAQPVEVLASALRQAWDETRHVVTLGEPAGESCSAEGC